MPGCVMHRQTFTNTDNRGEEPRPHDGHMTKTGGGIGSCWKRVYVGTRTTEKVVVVGVAVDRPRPTLPGLYPEALMYS